MTSTYVMQTFTVFTINSSCAVIVSYFDSHSMTAMPFHKKGRTNKQTHHQMWEGSQLREYIRVISPANKEEDGRMTIQNSAGEEYSPAHRVRFMSGVCFIAPPSKDADASWGNLLRRGLTSWYPLVFMGHQYGSQVMNYSANKPSTTTC